MQQDICGCHVHVGVPDLETAVAVMDRARPYLPVLLAMTGSSPFHDGVDTGYDSYRTMWWSRWPTTGPPEYLGSAERFAEVVAGLVDLRRDRRRLASLLGRPALLATCPTLEFRLADVCTEVDDVVLHAALVRSLVRVLAARAERGEPVPAAAARAAARGALARRPGRDRRAAVRPRARRAGRRAASPSAGCWPSCEDDLRDHDEWSEVVELVERLFERGTSAVAAAEDLAAHGRPAGGRRPDRPGGHRAGEL